MRKDSQSCRRVQMRVFVREGEREESGEGEGHNERETVCLLVCLFDCLFTCAVCVVDTSSDKLQLSTHHFSFSIQTSNATF